MGSPEAFPVARQQERFGPKFRRLADVLARDPAGLELTTDPTALAPESLLVFEVGGTIRNFVRAAANVPGLEFIDEEELSADDGEKAPLAYLMVPDATALQQILSLWELWVQNRDGQWETGLTPWRDVFSCLRDLRRWGPEDRIRDEDRDSLLEDIRDRPDTDLVRLEIELVFRRESSVAAIHEDRVGGAIAAAGGRGISRTRIEAIAYHALLVELPVAATRQIINRSLTSVAGVACVMHIRPQSVLAPLELTDAEAATAGQLPSPPDRMPILTLLDGVPIASHPLLAGRLNVSNLLELEDLTPVEHRGHGTAMASLIALGDRNRARQEAPLPRRIQVVPVLTWDGREEKLPDDRLIVDLIYTAVQGLRSDREAGLSDVVIVNVSLGNARRPFHGQMSPWARLLDWLAWELGLLFIVSAGNVGGAFSLAAFCNGTEFERSGADDRAAGVLRAIDAHKAERRLIAPAETVNGITVGSLNEDAVADAGPRAAGLSVDPYPGLPMANPSSRLGPGFANAIKPEILMPGGREHLRPCGAAGPFSVGPARPTRVFGLKVAAPPAAGDLGRECYTGGTSAAAALASRTCHRIHDALEDGYGSAFSKLSEVQRALVLKALLVHPARWAPKAVRFIQKTVHPGKGTHHTHRRTSVFRYLGYGTLDVDDAVACAADRATFWATGTLGPEQSVRVEVPIPLCIGGLARPHALWVTLAWFTPVQAGRRAYRCVRLTILDPEEIRDIALKVPSEQPDAKQIRRGTVTSRRWEGDRAAVVMDGMVASLIIQREPDTGPTIDEPVPFGLAVSLSMPGVLQVYDQVRQRLAPSLRPQVQPHA